MAKLEIIVTPLVTGVNTAEYHSFLEFTFDNSITINGATSNKWVIRGGLQNGGFAPNVPFPDLVAIYSTKEASFDSGKLGTDPSNYVFGVASGSDADILALYNLGVLEAQAINSTPTSYDLITNNCHNTASAVLSYIQANASSTLISDTSFNAPALPGDGDLALPGWNDSLNGIAAHTLTGTSYPVPTPLAGTSYILHTNPVSNTSTIYTVPNSADVGGGTLIINHQDQTSFDVLQYGKYGDISYNSSTGAVNVELLKSDGSVWGTVAINTATNERSLALATGEFNVADGTVIHLAATDLSVVNYGAPNSSAEGSLQDFADGVGINLITSGTPTGVNPDGSVNVFYAVDASHPNTVILGQEDATVTVIDPGTGMPTAYTDTAYNRVSISGGTFNAPANLTGFQFDNVQEVTATGYIKLGNAQLDAFRTDEVRLNVFSILVAEGGTYTLDGLNTADGLAFAYTGADSVSFTGNNANNQQLYVANDADNILVGGNGTGSSLVVYGNGNNTLTAGSGGELFTVSGNGVNILNGGTGNDTFNVTGVLASGSSVTGGGGNDTLSALGDVTQVAIAGVNTLKNSNVTLTASQFSDFTSLSGFNAVLASAANTTYSLAGKSIAGFGFTTLSTNGFDNVTLVSGSTGFDTLVADANNATLTGGTGDDTFDIIDAGTGTVVSGGDGNDILLAGTDISGVSVANDIETLQVGAGGSVKLTAAQLAGFDTVQTAATFDPVTMTFTYGTGVLFVDGGSSGTISLAGKTLLGDIVLDTSLMTGNNTLAGSSGRDTLKFAGNSSSYTMAFDASGTLVVSNGTNTTTITDVEGLQFADQSIDLTTTFADITPLSPISIGTGNRTNGKIDLLEGYTVSLLDAPAEGALTLRSNGSYTYTAPASFTGNTSFTYKLTSASGVSKEVEASINVATASTDTGAFTTSNTASSAGTITTSGSGSSSAYVWERPLSTALNSGNSVLTWTEYNSSSGFDEVYYQVFDAAGDAVTTPTRAGADLAHFQSNIQPVALADGGFALVWSYLNWIDSPVGPQSGSPYWQRFDANGVAQTDEIQVQVPTNGTSYWDINSSTMVQLANGDLAVFWGGRHGNSTFATYMSTYDTDATELVSNVLVSSGLSGHQAVPQAVALSNGNVAVTWRDESGNDGSGTGVYLSILADDGTVVSGPSLVNSTTTGDQNFPVIAVLNNGNVVVSWTSADASGEGVFAQIIDGTGTPVGSEFQVNSTTTGNQAISSITGLQDGGFFITWQAYDGSVWTINGQRYDASGSTVGSEVTLASSTSEQQYPNISELTNGDLMVTWRNGVDASTAVMEKVILKGTYDTPAVVTTYNGDISNYSITVEGNTTTVRDIRPGSPDGKHVITNATTLTFGDGTVDLTTLASPESSSLILPEGVAYNGQITVPSGYTVQSNGTPAQGALTLNSNGTYTYTAPSSFSGQTAFQYKLVSPQGVIQLVTMGVSVVAPASSSPSFGLNTPQTLESSITFQNSGPDSGFRERPLMTGLTGGGSVLTWTQYNSSTGFDEVYYQVYDSSGTSITSPTHLGSSLAHYQADIRPTALSDGSFVLTWSYLNWTDSPVGPQSGSQIWQRFDEDGVALSSEITVTTPSNSSSYWDVYGGSTIELSNGDLAVIWSGRMGTSTFAVYMETFDTSGTSLSSPVQISVSSGHQTLTNSVLLANGNIATIWRTEGGSTQDVYMRVMSASGTAVTSETLVTTASSGANSSPFIAALTGGGFVVTWSSEEDGSGYGVYGQLYSSSGSTVGSSFLINTTTADNQSYTTVTALSDGGFFMTWQSDNSSSAGIFGQQYDASGDTVGSEVQIASGSGLQQPSISQAANGDLLVTWRDGTNIKREVLTYSPGSSSGSGFTITGTTGNETLVGSSGDDSITSGAGNNLMKGNGGSDIYTFGSTFGNDTIVNGNGGTTAAGEIDFSSLSSDQLWFTQSGNDLLIEELGTDQTVKVENWFSSNGAKVEAIHSADNLTLDTQVSQLVSAMAAFSTGNPSFDPGAAVAMPTDTTLQAAITASWHTT